MYTTQGGIIIVNSAKIDFGDPIERVVDCNEYLLVEIPPCKSRYARDDTYAIAQDGQIVWTTTRYPGVVLHTNPCNFKIVGNTLTINGHSVTFDAPITRIREQNEVLIVLLLNTPQNDIKQNVFGVSGDGRILWRIPELPEGFSNSDQWNFFTTIYTPPDAEAKCVVEIVNAIGAIFTVNAISGELLSYRTFKE